MVGYIVYHYCLRSDRGMVHVVLLYCRHYYLTFDRGEVHVVVVVILSTIIV